MATATFPARENEHPSKEHIMRLAALVGAAAVALVSTAARAQNVSYDYDKSTDFSRFRTYAWMPAAGTRDELNDKRIIAAIDAQLATKGLSRVEPGANPDVLVSYRTNFKEDREIRGYTTGGGWGGYGRFGTGGTGSARTQDILVGALVVEMRDAKTRDVVWRSVASRDVDTKASPEKRDRNLAKAAEKMFKHYPTTK
jgi:hypothetical protein